MDKYKIDNNVPLPEDKSILLTEMTVGDSILFPLDRRRSVASTASLLKRTGGKQFTIKKVDDNNARVWRTK